MSCDLLRMAMVPENLEWSLPVPSVKELTIQSPGTVPARYIRDEKDTPIAPASDPSFCIPLIDMVKLVNPQDRETELQKLHVACRDWGMFQIINHGVCDELLVNMKKKTQEFFDLSQEEKKRYAQKPGSLEGYGQAFVVSEEQKLDWNDMIFLKSLPTENRKLEFWPEQPHKFRETIHNYSENMRETAVSIVGFISLVLGLEAEELSKAFQDGGIDLRLNCYPPCPESERVFGSASHADISGITLLLDCGDMPGLQVLKDGHWVYVKPIADALVVNIGNIVEIMSNGIYKAPFHRAVVNSSKERLSVATFCNPSTNVHIGPAKELIKPGSPALYKTLTLDEFLKRFFNWKLDAIPFIDTLKI